MKSLKELSYSRQFNRFNTFLKKKDLSYLNVQVIKQSKVTPHYAAMLLE